MIYIDIIHAIEKKKPQDEEWLYHEEMVECMPQTSTEKAHWCGEKKKLG